MTLMQFAFVLLCLAQMIHFSKHWYLLTARLREDARDKKMRQTVDWKAPKRRK